MSKPERSEITESGFSLFNARASRTIQSELTKQHERDRDYISDLEMFVLESGLQVPEEIKHRRERRDTKDEGLLQDGSLDSLAKSFDRIKPHSMNHEINVQYRNLTFWNDMPKKTIPTVGSNLKSLFMGPGKKQRVDIIKDLTGRILPGRMTLVMGPPGCGKTTFLKALAGQLTAGSAHLEGEVLYNGDSIDCGKYLVGKVATYADEKEQHAGVLTVRETMDFAWYSTTGGHHSYNIAKDDQSAAILDKDDASSARVNNVLKVLGLSECGDTLVGDDMVRGVSGGQKRRVTLGEMLIPPRTIKFLDAISNGLDAATTYDIIQALKFATNEFGTTTVISLLQPAPDVFYSFADVIVMADGQIIYHGPTTSVLDYFQGLGYHCPESMDLADFLQEVPTAEGRRFTIGHSGANGSGVPYGTDALMAAWKESVIFNTMQEEMDVIVKESTGKWPEVYNERYPGSFWYHFKHCLGRESKLIMRNTAFLKGRVAQALVIGAIAGSLFSNLATEDSNSMSGILFFSALTGALSALSMLPMVFEQRAVFYKHSRGLFYPTTAYVFAQTVVMYPVMIIETIVFISIIYWSVGLSADYNGSRFFTFLFVVLVFTMAVSQYIRLVASALPTAITAQPISGVVVMLMILFSGFIVPKNNIPDGWIWFYYINPVAYVLQSVTINEFLAPDYDFLSCTDNNNVCERFGDVVLKSRGNPTEQVWVWYGVAVMTGLYLVFLVLTTLALVFIRREGVPPPRIVIDYSEEVSAKEEETEMVNIPFEPVSFSFKDVWYTVTLPTGEDLDLLKGVSGFFEPGTVTALMGSSGAGKTTLLDVLAGRKNTGEVSGGLFVNGKPKNDQEFKKIMGYVEQFDTLAPNDTAREAIEFSAALRLPGSTPADIRAQWVTTVLTLLELIPLEKMLVGNSENGGMSFEQKKRVSIGVELAANPAILFLDEPTSGLDSRSAQVVIRCIKRVAASGRSVVCTIHQPSTVIYEAFESLLLLKRGGQTVYFGELGDKGCNLVSYMEAIPGVKAKPKGTNPATWMLEVIGAGTSGANHTDTDFHAAYCGSALSDVNTTKINILCPDEAVIEANELDLPGQSHHHTIPGFFRKGRDKRKLGHAGPKNYNSSYWVQFRVLMYRFALSYWRSPTYNFGRIVVSIIIALIFSSTYANQKYHSDVDVISRVALIYITLVFTGVIGMMSVQPVIFDERPAFYREQFSDIYDVKLYTLAATLVEVPYLIMSSIAFLVPFFFIVGFDDGDTTIKFFWYWLFQAIYMSALVFIGHFLAVAVPNAAAAQVLGGMSSTFMSLFCGFMIKPSDFPDFWIFMYWLNPVHYVIEGLITTQFNRDHTLITITGSDEVVTAQTFVSDFYDDWHYSARGYDILALGLFIVVLRYVTYLCLVYVRYDKR